jgi:protein-S-isoprenylcysteine O-methyltransferase Ste14
MRRVAAHIIFACWIVYILYWIISAKFTKPVAERQDWARFALNRIPTTIGGLLLLWPKPTLLDYRLTPDIAWVESLGAAVVVLGLVVAIWARRTLAANWSGTVQFKVGHELVEKGPYRFVRHPIYTGILLLCLGTAIYSARLGSWLGFGLIFLGFWIKLRQEEVLMTRHFPAEYPAYKARVKALIPFVL